MKYVNINTLSRKEKFKLTSLNQIFNNPETRFEEFKACELLSNWLEGRGWKVSRGVYGLETAFEAKFSVVEGGRTVCFNAEYGECLSTYPSCVSHL